MSYMGIPGCSYLFKVSHKIFNIALSQVQMYVVTITLVTFGECEYTGNTQYSVLQNMYAYKSSVPAQ